VGGGGYEPEYVVRCWVLLLAELSGMSPDEAHPEAEAWLREPSVEPDEEADTRSLVTARQARVLVFPMHGLGAR
jgi:acetoin utilization deacetylase AcuC-like enzyme